MRAFPRASTRSPVATVDASSRVASLHQPLRVLSWALVAIGIVQIVLMLAEMTKHGPTIHANSAEQALARFSSCVVQSGIELPYQAVRYQIADAIDLVLHLGRDAGRRVVRELIRVGRYDVDRDRYEHDELFSSGVSLAQSSR